MDGDVTRSTNLAAVQKHYRSVLMQQGRVQTDADWNEQFAVLGHREQAEIVDAFGQAAAPWYDSGFHIVTDLSQLYPPEQVLPGNQLPPAPPPIQLAPPPASSTERQVGGTIPVKRVPPDFYISAGRFYVDGILCENERLCTYLTQPDLPNPALPDGAGTYLVYLHVWFRHIDWIDDGNIREVALGGPDTATRWKTVWQVKFQPVDEESNCASAITIGEEIAVPVTLQARAEPDPVSDDPCVVAPGAGYRGLKNETYRVEIHQGGVPGTATWKWARNNASVESAWLAVNNYDLTVADIGRDPDLSFAKGLWVELLDDARILNGIPGTYAQIAAVNGNVVTIDPATIQTGSLALPAASLHPRVRLWDSPLAPVAQSGPDGFIALEDGVEVKFSLAGTARTGDNWEIPARVATALGPANILWPPGADATALDQPPAGIRHHYAHLAIGLFDGLKWVSFEDCRKRFAPANEDVCLFFLGGDGQVALVHGAANVCELPEKLSVGVSLGGLPLAGARVLFQVIAGGGGINGVASAIVTTGANGVAQADFILDGQTPVQQVTATLLDPANAPKHLPVTFTARLLYADGVFYDPKNCEDLKDANTVQKAIDALCKLLHAPPAIFVDSVMTFDGTTPIFNDMTITGPLIENGVRVVCSETLVSLGVGDRPVCTLSVDLPWPATDTDIKYWQGQNVGFQTIRLAGTTVLGNAKGKAGNAILWAPAQNTITWLGSTLPAIMARHQIDHVLMRLHVEGRFVWESQDPTVYLDGTTFGRRAKTSDRLLDLILPSGDKRRVADFDMWFWLGATKNPLQVHTVEFWRYNAAGQPIIVVSSGDLPLADGAPPPQFLNSDEVSMIHIAFNRAINTAGIVPNGKPQSALVEYVDAGKKQRIFGDLAMLDGSTTTAVFTVANGTFLRSTGSYNLTVIGSPNDEGFVAVTAADDDSGLDGTYTGDIPADFSLNFTVNAENPVAGNDGNVRTRAAKRKK
ncbi:MAG TPA: DUF6519 domain-containing protein [Rhizomicrobium sp.]|nr:DUF6519 domain-containing protein [Rhizomicrobium sp.]